MSCDLIFKSHYLNHSFVCLQEKDLGQSIRVLDRTRATPSIPTTRTMALTMMRTSFKSGVSTLIRGEERLRMRRTFFPPLYKRSILAFARLFSMVLFLHHYRSDHIHAHVHVHTCSCVCSYVYGCRYEESFDVNASRAEGTLSTSGYMEVDPSGESTTEDWMT